MYAAVSLAIRRAGFLADKSAVEASVLHHQYRCAGSYGRVRGQEAAGTGADDTHVGAVLAHDFDFPSDSAGS
jgi:hypothetical protein